jgi:DNA-binding IclR family transcriptional regulator
LKKKTTKTDSRRYHVPNLERALRILEYLTSHPNGCTVPELMRALDIPKMTVYRIAKTLQAQEYLQLNDDGQSFRLGRKFLTLGHAAVGEENLVEKSLDVMRTLRDVTNETVLLGTLIGREGVVLEQVLSTRPVRFMIEIGHRFPLHTSAPGKAMLAFLPEEERTSLLSHMKLTKFTERTITTRKDFLNALENVRKKGYAVDDQEEYEELRCVGSTILNHRGYPVAAVWVTGPAFRFSHAKIKSLGKVVAEKARMISARFGYDLIQSF